MDFGPIAFGLEAKGDYDAAFSNLSVPIMLLVGFHRDFWLGLGHTVGVTPMSITASGNTVHGYEVFPNTLAMGFGTFRIPLGFGTLLFLIELICTYYLTSTHTELLFALKASIAVGLEMKL
jgi:hypothetical protein